MLFRKINERPVNRVSAFSLVELLISMSLGSFILLSIIAYYSDVFLIQQKSRELLNLQNNSHQLLNYLQQHIQHIGFQGKDRENHNYTLFQVNHKSYWLENSQCFTFFYDLNKDGCLGKRKTGKNKHCIAEGLNNTTRIQDEVFGFKLENKVISAYSGGRNIQSCYMHSCQSLLKNCTQDGWRKISDMADYQVEKLHFEWLKEGELLKIELTLSSVKLPHIQYASTAYSYLLNAGE